MIIPLYSLNELKSLTELLLELEYLCLVLLLCIGVRVSAFCLERVGLIQGQVGVFSLCTN